MCTKHPQGNPQNGRWLAVAGAVSRAHLKSWKLISILKSEENWLWLSRQVAAVLAEPHFSPKVQIAANLLVALRRAGFASDQTNGLDGD